jgi:minor extracellular serine protease Vpr
MKHFFTSLTFLISACCSFAQNTAYTKPKLSASTKLYLWKMDQLAAGKSQPQEEFVYKLDASGNTYVSALIKVQPGFTESLLSSLGVKIGTKAGNVWTAQVPLSSVRNFTTVNGISYIEMDQPASPALDTARKTTRVDSVHAGYGLPQGYSGSNVVVGVIDAGFDYTHPTFYDTAYSLYRIKRVWEEKNTSGTPPAGFSYGTEYSDSLSIITKAHDITSGTHGTHVSGIAAGSGSGGPLGNNTRFRGMAYNSDVVMVGIYPSANYWLNTGMTDMLDGINYVYNYASSVSKPAVANLSWGCPLGPHDGSSLFSQACDALTGPGRIFVLSGGNNGSNNIHLKKVFDPTDTLVSTFLTFPTGLSPKRNWVDVWGDTSKTFCMQFSLYSGLTKIDSTVMVCLDDTTHRYNLIGSNGDTCFITVTTVLSEFNNKPHMLIQALSRVNDRLCLTVKANDGTINMWQGLVINTSGYYGVFTKYSYTFASNGDNIMNVSDMVTTQSAIGVAAYNSKPTFVNVAGSTQTYTGYPKGAIASFSSKGPTVDGRTKPNIAGPGMALASSVSSVDSTYLPAGANYNSVVSAYISPVNGVKYSYAMAAGTSMSGPAVSGIVALLLEADPTLSPTQVMNILYQTAITDSYTGVIPPTGSNTWGWGKVNAYHAMMQVLGLTTGIHHEETGLSCLLYPNPGNGNYSVEYVGEQAEKLDVFVYDVSGKKLLDESWEVHPGSNVRRLEMGSYPAGIYLAVISGKQGRTTVRIVKQ